MTNDVVDQICADLHVPHSLVKEALRLAYSRFRKLRVPKRSGTGYRTIVQPAAELKLIQQWLLINTFSKLPISKIATAFEPASSIVINAHTHKDSLYSVRVDLANFFPSITYQDLAITLSANADSLPLYKASDFGSVVRRACFNQEDQLPIGYTSSPCIANAVMYTVDQELELAISSEPSRFGHAALTRYADDFVFSTNKRGACHDFVKLLRAQLASTSNPKLFINDSKTRYMSRNGGSTLVTGLRINKEGLVRVHQNYRDHVRLLLKLYAEGRLKAEEIESLRGHLAFTEHADPRLFTRLSFKYYAHIAKLRGR